jgi:hypothetical protein
MTLLATGITPVVRHGAAKTPDLERKRGRAVAWTTLVGFQRHLAPAFVFLTPIQSSPAGGNCRSSRTA